MKRWHVYLAAVVAAILLPRGQEMDIGKLQPVELIHIYKESNVIVVRTDTGDLGIGSTLDQAFGNMKQTSVGEIFLETVDYVLLSEEMKDKMPELEQTLRPAAHILVASARINPEDARAYLNAHPTKVTLKDCMAGESKLPKLMTVGDRYYVQ